MCPIAREGVGVESKVKMDISISSLKKSADLI